MIIYDLPIWYPLSILITYRLTSSSCVLYFFIPALIRLIRFLSTMLLCGASPASPSSTSPSTTTTTPSSIGSCFQILISIYRYLGTSLLELQGYIKCKSIISPNLKGTFYPTIGPGLCYPGLCPCCCCHQPCCVDQCQAGRVLGPGGVHPDQGHGNNYLDGCSSGRYLFCGRQWGQH